MPSSQRKSQFSNPLSGVQEYLWGEANLGGHTRCSLGSVESHLGRAIHPTEHPGIKIDRSFVYPLKLWADEIRLAAKIKSVSEGHPSPFPKCQTDWLSRLQNDAVNLIGSSALSILNGPPGVGKTRTAVEVIKLALGAGQRVFCMAPTGKAAARIQEALGEGGIAGLRPRTIHRALEWKVSDTDPEGFPRRGKNAPFDCDLLIVDECFVGDTLVSVPGGYRRIKDFNPGDKILNAIGEDTVVGTSKREAETLAQVNFGATSVTASENHQFFTSRGLVCAKDLKCGDLIVSVREAMRLMREPIQTKEMDISLLLFSLQRSIYSNNTRIQGQDVHRGEGQESWGGKESISGQWQRGGKKTNRQNTKFESDEFSGDKAEGLQDSKDYRASSSDSGREWETDSSTPEIIIRFPDRGLEIRVHNPNQNWKGPGVSNSLQTRYCQPGIDDCYRGRRNFSQHTSQERARREKDKIPDYFRVESVEILQSTDSRLDKFREANGKLYLYDLQAKQHSSYAVEDSLVHNCSMLDLSLAASLFDAINPGTRVVFIGDANQLPPVGPGQPFIDMINSGFVPTFTLVDVWRQAQGSKIWLACQAIMEQSPYDFFRYATRDGDEIAFNALDSSDRIKAFFKSGIQNFHGNPNDLQILTPIREKGPASAVELNRLAAHLLNPSKAPHMMLGQDGVGHPGDRVIQTRNNYMRSVFNGDQGTIREIGPQEIKMEVAKRGKRFIQWSRWPLEHEVGESLPVLGADLGDTYLPYTETEAENELMLSYALTVHKFQGSEAPHVAIACPIESWGMMGRRLLLTAVSRARKRAVLAGPTDLLVKAITTDKDANRRSGLQERLK